MDTMPRHGGAFLEARKPRVILVRPEPEWVLDSYRVRCWYYRDAPAIGDKVTYLQDGFSTRITNVNFLRVYFADSTSMRRPELGRRIWAWVLPRLQNRITIPKWAPSRGNSTLRPDAATILV